MPEEIAPLLRLGLEDDVDSAGQTLDATIRVKAPTPRTGGNAKPRGWEPPSVEQLQQMLPQYHVTNFIARGGMGAVYKGQQKALKRPVAIKVLPPEIHEGSEDMQFSERFKHEAQAMARLTHPNIVAVFDAGETADSLLYFVMEFIEGTDVAQLIASEGLLEPQRAIDITVAVCEALAFAHEEGIVHRDIKPSNIMIDKRGRVKVADFGLAKSVNLEATLLTGTNLAMGTPDFIAPEAMIPGMKIDQRADLYAVGVMLYQMLTGKIPRGRFLLPSGIMPQIDHRFDAIVDKAMQTDREKRYSTAFEIKTDVEQVRTTSVPQLSPRSGNGPVLASGATGTGEARSLSKPLFIGIAAAGIVALVGAFQAFKGKPASGGVASPSSTASSVVKAGAQSDAIKLWDTPEKLPEKSGVSWENGALCLQNNSIDSSMPLSRDGIIRASIKMNRNAETPQISLRVGGDAGRKEDYRYHASFYRRDGKPCIILTRVLNGVFVIIGEWPMKRAYSDDEWADLELRAVGDTLTVSLDREVLGTVHDAKLTKPGRIKLFAQANGHFRDITYIPLDGLPEAGALKLAGVDENGKDVRGKTSDTPATEKWERIWNEGHEVKSGMVVVEDGWIECKTDGPRRSTLLSFNQWWDSAIRCEWRWAEGSADSHISVRQSGVLRSTSRYTLLRTKNSIRLSRTLSSEDNKVLKEYPINEPKIGDIYTLELCAVGTTLTAKLDGKEIIRVEDSQLTAGSPSIYLQGAAAMRNIEVLNLDATGARTPIPPSPALPWDRMWNEPSEFRDTSSVMVEGGWLVSKVAPPGGGTLVYPRQWRDSAIRSEWRWAEGSVGSHLSVRQWEASRYRLFRSRTAIRLEFTQPDGRSKVLKEYPINEPKIGETFTLELWAVGTTLTAKLDGKEIIRVEDTQLAAGGPALYLHGAAAMRNIEVLNLDVAEAKSSIGPTRSLPGAPSPALGTPAARID